MESQDRTVHALAVHAMVRACPKRTCALLRGALRGAHLNSPWRHPVRTHVLLVTIFFCARRGTRHLPAEQPGHLRFGGNYCCTRYKIIAFLSVAKGPQKNFFGAKNKPTRDQKEKRTKAIASETAKENVGKRSSCKPPQPPVLPYASLCFPYPHRLDPSRVHRARFKSLRTGVSPCRRACPASLSKLLRRLQLPLP